MLNRSIEFPKRQSFFLFGARQTGKSTLIRARYHDAWYVDLLNNEVILRYFRDPTLFRAQAKERILSGTSRIIIDEVQRAPSLLNEVQSLMFDHPHAQFIMTGSSARKLKRGAANLLGGRAAVCHLYPFVYEELKNASLDDVLRWGSLPALQDKTAEEKIDTLNAYGHVYLQEEIKSEGIARNLEGFTRFLDIAASQSGELLSYSAIARECHLPVRTVQSYYDILEDTLLGIRLEGWQKSVRKRLVTHPKFYLFDIGVTNALNRRLGGELDALTRGRLFEQYIVLETYRMAHYLKSSARLYYWRTNHGAEVDLVIEKQGKPVYAVEIKHVARVSGAELSGLRAFNEEYQKTKRIVVSKADQPAYEIDDVQIIGWRDYFGKLRDILKP